MAKKIVTQEDLDKYPELAEQGIQIGDEAEIPEDGDDQGDDVGGSKPPTDKERPDRP